MNNAYVVNRNTGSMLSSTIAGVIARFQVVFRVPPGTESGVSEAVDRPGFLGGCDLWEGRDSWHLGRRTPRSCGNER